MASLRKPQSCTACNGNNLLHLFDPERWECVCGTVLAQRPRRQAGICRKCGASEKDKPFKKGKNLCLDCHNEYMREWRLKNPDWDQDPDFRRRRFEAVKRATQRSPEAFIKHLYNRLMRPSREKHQRNGQYIPPKHLAMLNNVLITYDYLVELYYSATGRCMVTGMSMTYEIGNLRSISIDRIDAGKGYIPGNIQLVCQWANFARLYHPLSEFKQILSDFVAQHGGVSLS